MTEENFILEDEFAEEVLNLHMTTVVRLFSEGSDVATLYLFYCKNAKLQKTNSVYSTDTFCIKGLGWGSNRFYKAKKLLQEKEFISPVVRRDSETQQITGHYIKIHYLKSGASLFDIHRVDRAIEWTEPQCGKRETNAYNKKINTEDEKGNTFKIKKEILSGVLSYWNKHEIINHKDIDDDTCNKIVKFISLRSKKDLLCAIHNYSVILHSDDYFFKYKWTLKEFLQRGLSAQGMKEGKGIWYFITENDPFSRFSKGKTDPVKDKFKPITSKYTNVLDTVNQTFYGFRIPDIKNPLYYLSEEIEYKLSINEFDYSSFCYLEGVIAGLLLRQKSMIEGDPEKLKRAMEIWEEKKPEFIDFSLTNEN